MFTTTLIVLFAIAVLMVLGAAAKTVHSPGNLLPGLEGILESQDDTVQIGEANTTGTITFTLDGDFKDAPRPLVSAEIDAKSAGSATTKITRVEVTNRTAAEVEVTVELDAAPGAGETTTIRVFLLAAGKANK